MALPVKAEPEASPSQSQYSHLCGSLYVKKSEKKNFDDLNPNEKKTVCGEEGTSWADLPLEQMQLHLKTILQQKGYSSIAFETAGDRTIVHVEKRTEIKNLELAGEPQEFFKRSKIAIV